MESSNEALKQQLIDEIYDIALDPSRLASFVERYAELGIDRVQVQANIAHLATLDQEIASHAERAQVFLERFAASGNNASGLRPLDAALEPFGNTPGIVLDASLMVAAVNSAASNVFQLGTGHSFEDLPIDADASDEFLVVMRRLLRSDDGRSVMLHFKSNAASRVIVFQATKLDGAISEAHEQSASNSNARRSRHGGHILLISTELNWPPALDQTLEEVFSVSRVEREIIRSLVEGQDLKTIADDRGRSHETVRTQLRSILQKTGARSQTELVRLTLSLLDVVERSTKAISHSASADAILRVGNEQLRPFASITLPDGRNLDYLIQGDPNGQPILFSHMGYGLCRWPEAAQQFARENGLCVVSPVRMGYGGSGKAKKITDLNKLTRDDTLAVMDALKIDRCPYVAQGNDLVFAVDLAGHHPDRITQIIGLGGRLPLSGDLQYSGMGRWHRFFFSTARQAPHLLHFTAKAAFTLARKIGYEEMFRSMHRDSPADLAVIRDRALFELMHKSTEAMIGKDSHAEYAYAVELLVSERDWSDLVHRAKDTPIRIFSGLQDPLANAETLSAYREFFPQIDCQAFPDAGQLIFFQKYNALLPIILEAAKASQRLPQTG